MALRHYVTSVNKKKLSQLQTISRVRILQGAACLYPFLKESRIIKCIILMADCDPERIVFMKHIPE